MRRPLTTGLFATALCMPVAAMGQESSAELDAMKAELAAMRAELTQLKSDAPTTTTYPANAELKAATEAAMLDAQTRINYQADQMLAGHDGKKFFLESADGNFSLGLSAQGQVRYIYNHRENAPVSAPPDIDDGDDLSGFQLRRMKVKGDGYIADPKIGYNFTFASNRDSNATILEEFAVSYEFDSGVELSAGRFKAPFAFDELTSSSRQQAVERSLINEQFTIGFTEGIQAGFNPADDVLVRVMLNDGAGAGEGGNGDFNETPTDFAITGRADFTIGGSKGFAKDYVSWVEDEMGINIGVAAHHEQVKSGVGGAANADLDAFTRFTADVLYNNAGLSLFGAVYLETQDAITGGVEADPFGFQVQGGYTIDDTWEPFARYEWIDPDTGGDEISVITVGVNYYLKKHSAKFTIDGVYALDPLTGIGVSDGLGLQGDAAGEDGQYAIRAQFQILF